MPQDKVLSLVERIDRQISAATGELHAAAGEHAELALALVENPANESVQAALLQLEDEQAQHRRNIANLTAAKAEAEKRDSVQFRAAEIAGFKAKRAAVAQAFDQLGELAVRIKAIRKQQWDLQSEYASIARPIHSDVWSTLRAILGPQLAERRYPYEVGYIARGQDVLQFVYENMTADGTDADLKAALTKGPQRVLDAMDRAIAERVAEVKGTAPAAPESFAKQAARRFVKGRK